MGLDQNEVKLNYLLGYLQTLCQHQDIGDNRHRIENVCKQIDELLLK